MRVNDVIGVFIQAILSLPTGVSRETMGVLLTVRRARREEGLRLLHQCANQPRGTIAIRYL